MSELINCHVCGEEQMMDEVFVNAGGHEVQIAELGELTNITLLRCPKCKVIIGTEEN